MGVYVVRSVMGNVSSLKLMGVFPHNLISSYVGKDYNHSVHSYHTLYYMNGYRIIYHVICHLFH